MQYEPLKNKLGALIKQSVCLNKLLFFFLDLLLLRTWHIKKELRYWAKTNSKNNQQPPVNRNDISILDGGSGYGQYVYFLSKLNKNWKIKGIDINEKQVQNSNNLFLKMNKPTVTFHKNDLVLYNEFDVNDLVLSVDVMEHIEEDRRVFRNFYNSLKTGGMLLISTPSDKGGSDTHDEHDKSFIEEHVRNGYNIDEMKEKLNEAGFNEIDIKYVYGKPGHISWLLSMKAPLKLINISKYFFLLLPFYYLITFPFCFILNYADLHCKHKEGTGLIVKAKK